MKLVGIVQEQTVAAADDLSIIKRYLTGLPDSLRGAAAEGAAAGALDVDFDVRVLGMEYEANGAGSWANRESPFVAVRLSHALLLVSYFLPGASPCPACLERRWVALRPIAERRAIEDKISGSTFGLNPWLSPFALEAIRSVIEAALGRREPAEEMREMGHEVYALNLQSLRVVKHRLIPDSLCPGCASPQLDSPSAATVILASQPKPTPSSYRLKDSSEMRLPESAYINPVCGVLGGRSYYDYTHSLMAPVNGNFLTRGTRGEHPVWWSGHGTSYEESLTVGMLEGLERHAGLLPRKKEVAVFDCYQNLKQHALNPLDCGLYDAHFYPKHHFFEPFSPTRDYYWVWGYSLTHSRPILVPEQLVYYTDYTRQQSLFVQDCSNGCAIGSCLEEAIFSGLMELIERDSFLISWSAKLPLPQIDPWSCRTPETLFLLDRIERLGCEVHFLDMRLDLGIPAVMGLTRRRDQNLGAMVFAAGCSFDPEKAISGALIEIASYVCDFDRRVAAEQSKVREMMDDYHKVEKLGDHAMLYGLPEMAERVDFLFNSSVCRSVDETYQQWREECPRNLDLRDDIRFCVERLRSVGLDQVIVIDQTSPEQEHLGFNTACVIVPGLVPIDFGYGRERGNTLRRLYTVPRTAGFRKTDLTPAELNSDPHPFP